MDQRENDTAEEDYLATSIIILVLGVSGLLLMAWAWFALYHQLLSIPFQSGNHHFYHHGWCSAGPGCGSFLLPSFLVTLSLLIHCVQKYVYMLC